MKIIYKIFIITIFLYQQTNSMYSSSGNSSSAYVTNTVNDKNIYIHAQGSSYLNFSAKKISDTYITVNAQGSSSVSLSWWYGKRPNMNINLQGSSSVYIGYSKLFYYTSCLAAFGLGIYIGSHYFR
jgi:hypothetical protein